MMSFKVMTLWFALHQQELLHLEFVAGQSILEP
jgi:hypothetical protein